MRALRLLSFGRERGGRGTLVGAETKLQRVQGLRGKNGNGGRVGQRVTERDEDFEYDENTGDAEMLQLMSDRWLG